MDRTSFRRTAACVLALFAAPSCGLGTAGIAGGLSGGGGGGGTPDTPPALSAFAVEDPKLSPCTSNFVLTDLEGGEALIELRYQVSGGLVRRAEHVLSGMPSNPGTLLAPPGGLSHAVRWDFAAETDLDDAAAYEPGVRVWAVVSGGVQKLVVGANGAEVGLGNDEPGVVVETPGAEVDGIVPMRITLADSSDDAVRVRVEYDIVDDVPDAGWRLARPAGLESGEPTPEWAIEGIVAPSTGVQVVFFWDTDVDLAQLERVVVLRFTPEDPVVAGAPAFSDEVRVDNNDEPTAVIQAELVLASGDRRGGVPIPFRLIDDESDSAQVVFQWRFQNQAFPDLPEYPAELAELLADPAWRREQRICTPHVPAPHGTCVPVDATRVRLPELAAGASHLVANGLVGRDVEILRASHVPEPLAAVWTENVLTAPVAAHPLGDGRRALVLDRSAPNAWRLVEIELATGTLVREIATSTQGEPTAFAMERDGAASLVATYGGGVWSLERVTLTTGTLQLVVSKGPVETAWPVRGLTSLGTQAVLLTAGSSLVRVDWVDLAEPRGAVVIGGLQTPWGITPDRVLPGRFYLAERDAPVPAGTGRVVVVDLRTGKVEPLRAAGPPSGFAELPRPTALAFDPRRGRLLAACEDAGVAELRAVALGGRSGNATARLAELELLPTSIAIGPEGLTLLALPNDLSVAGGLEQRRSIVAYDAWTQVATLDAPLVPPLEPGRSWRLAQRFAGAPAGRDVAFAWDVSDVIQGGGVFLRATPYDAEIGIAGETLAPIAILSRYQGVEPLEVLGATRPTTGDIDRDGDIDLVAADLNGQALRLFLQSVDGGFETPIEVDTPARPWAVVIADADADGDGDLVCVLDDGTLSTFRQTDRGTFETTPLAVGFPEPGLDLRYLTTADLDADGDCDFVLSNSGQVRVVLQTAPGVLQFQPDNLAHEFGHRRVDTADLDGDGDLDLIVPRTFGVDVHFQTGPAVFDTTPMTLGDSNFVNDTCPVDLDGDGDLDLAATGDGTRLFYQTAPGVFDPPVPLDLGPAPNWVDAADVDSDGDMDLFASSSLSSLDPFLSVALNNGAGHFDRRLLQVDLGATPTGGGVEDLDGYGTAEVVVGTNAGARVLSAWAPGTVSSSAELLGSDGTVASPRDVAGADLDADGDLDLVVANITGPSLTGFLQTSPGTFGAPPWPFGVVGAPTIDVELADVDGDGRMDAVTADNTHIRFYRQLAPGTFEATSIGGTGMPQPRHVALVDLDGDHDLDVLSGHSSSVRAFYQQSPGVFGRGEVLVEQGGATFVTGDLDGDGDLDVVFGEEFDTSLRILRNEGGGLFDVLVVPDFFPFGPVGLAALDADGDGDLDLVGSLGFSSAVVHLQIGELTFDPEPLAIPGVQARAFAAADLDRDLDIDLVAVSLFGGTIQVVPQTSPASFLAVDVLVGGALQTALALDLDGDGEIDLAAPDNDFDRVGVYWNGR